MMSKALSTNSVLPEFAPTVSRRARREHRRGIGRVASATRWQPNMASTKRRIDHFAKEVRKLPLQKLGDPGDVARVIAFLASDVSKHVTGADYTVDGGIVAAA